MNQTHDNNNERKTRTHKMWCFVFEPNGTIHELMLPKGSRGLDCLEMVSSRIHLVEKDYFGLRHTNPSTGLETWINLRNKLSQQLHGKAPYRIQLDIKFYVKVQELQQPITRDLFYSSLVQQLDSGKINVDKLEEHVYMKLVAHMAQVEYGDFDAESLPDYSSMIPSNQNWSDEFQQMVETEHLKLDTLSPSEVKIQFLTIVSNLDVYGVESFVVQSVGEKQEELVLTVRHDGLRVHQTEKSNDVSFIPYDEISTVSYKGRKFTIVHGNARSEHSHSSFQLKKNHAAIHLFRTFTEFHSFFQCNTVKKSVVEKCSQSSIRRIMSIFQSHPAEGKMFLFDVVRTRRQAYDHAWSILNAPDKKRQSAFYHSERNFNRKSVYSLSKIDEGHDYNPSQDLQAKNDMEYFVTESKDDSQVDLQKQNKEKEFSSLSVDELRETVNNLIENQMCQVCMDAKVSTAFCPCGHVVCCVNCATMCRECPLCRMQITYAQRVFFSST